MDFIWQPPTQIGGCPILGYELYLDDGNDGAFTSVDSGVLGGKQYLRSHTVTLPSSSTGKTFRFKVKSFNEIDSTFSFIGSQILASVPAKPTAILVSDLTVTGTQAIKAVWTELADNGGSEITSYSLEIDDGTGGDFVAVVGLKQSYLRLYYTADKNITKGVT